MPYEAGTATLQIAPSFLNVETMIARAARDLAKGLDGKLGKDLGKAFENAGKDAEKDASRAGQKLGRAFAENAMKNVESAFSRLPEGDKILKPLRDELEAISKIDLGKGFDEKAFIARIERAQEAAKKLQQDAQGVNAVGRFTNAGNAAADLQVTRDVVETARRRGFEAGDAFVNAYQARLKAMRAATPDLKVREGSSPEERHGAALRQRIDDAAKVNVGDVVTREHNPLNLKIGVKVSREDLAREMATIEGLLDQFVERFSHTELVLPFDKARQQAGAFFSDIKTQAEKEAEAEAKAYLDAWDEAHKEQWKRDQRFRQDLLRAHEDAVKEDFKLQRKKIADEAALWDDAIKEDFKRRKKALDDFGRLWDDAVKEQWKRDQKARQDFAQAWDDAVKEQYKRDLKARQDFDRMYDEAVLEGYRRQKKIQDDFLAAHDDAIKEQYKRDLKARQDYARAYDDAVAEDYKRQKKAREDFDRDHRSAIAEQARRDAAALAGTTAGRVQQGTRGASGAIQEIKITASSTEADKKIAAIRAKLDALGKREIGVNISVNDFATEAEAEFAKLTALAHDKTVEFHVRADAAKAATELGAVLVLLHRIDGKKAEVKVDTDGANAGLRQMLSALSLNLGRLGALIAAGASIGTAIVPVAAAAASAIGAIGTAALAAASGVGVMILGFSGIGEAVKQMGNLADSQAKSANSLTHAGNAVAGASDQVKTAEMALAKTRRANAAAAIKAQRDIKDAIVDQRDAVREVARDMQDAIEHARDAQRDLTHAEQDAVQAREALNEAYREAQRAIDDLNSSVRGNALDQRQATIDIAKAKEALDKALTNPRATQLERDQAQVTYEERLLQMDDLQRKGAELADDQEKRLAAGVKGSKEVKKAEQDILDADEKLGDAQRALTRAVQDRDQARVDGQRKLAQAQQKVADAQQAAAEQQRDAAYSQFTATQGLAGAQRALANAYSQSGVAGGAALDNLHTAMAKLSPQGRKLAKYIFGLRDAFFALRRAADPMLKGAQQAMTVLVGQTSQDAIKKLKPLFAFVHDVADALGGIFVRFANTLKGPAFTAFFGYIRDTAVPTLNDLYTASENLIVGFLNLFLAFTPLTGQVQKGFVGMTADFRKWSEGLSKNQGFQDFITYLRVNGPKVAKLIGRMVAGLWSIIEAAAPIGSKVVDAFSTLFRWIDLIPVDTLTAIAAGIAAASAALGLFALGTQIAALSTAGLVSGGIAILAVALIALVASSDGAKAALTDAWEKIKVALTAAWEVIWPVLKGIGKLFVDLWALAMPTLKQLGGMFVWLWNNAIVPAAKGIWEVLKTLWETIRPVFEAIIAIIRPVATIIWWLLKNVVIPVVAGIVYALVKILTPVIKFLWTFIVKPILLAIGLAFQIVAAIVKVAVGLIVILLKAIGNRFVALWKNDIKPAWDKLVNNVFKPMGRILEPVKSAWETTLKGLAAMWTKLRQAVTKPIKFIVETVLNDGLLKGYNWLADKFNIEPKNVHIDGPKGGWGFASGGAVHGPGTGTSDSVRARLSRGEHVLTAEEVEAAGGHGAIYALRRAILGGRLLPGFARGGAVGEIGGLGDIGAWLKKQTKALGKKATDAFTSAADFFSDPLGSITKLAKGLFDKIPGKDTWFVQKLASIPAKILDALKDKVTGLFSGGGEDGAGAGVFGNNNRLGGSGGMIGILRAVFPGLNLNSGFRPGSVTAGTKRKSLHSMNRAVDVPPRMDVFEWIRAHYPDSRELIFSPAGARQLYRGKSHVYSGITKQMHYNHVHWGYDKGGLLPDTRKMPGGVMSVFHGKRTPDKVLTDTQWNHVSVLAGKARESMSGGDTYNFPYRDSTLNADELDRFFSRRDALNRVNRVNF